MSGTDITHPERYTQGRIEVWDAIDLLGLDYFQGNVLKYVARHKLKGGLEDLEKAQQYIKKLALIHYNTNI